MMNSEIVRIVKFVVSRLVNVYILVQQWKESNISSYMKDSAEHHMQQHTTSTPEDGHIDIRNM